MPSHVAFILDRGEEVCEQSIKRIHSLLFDKYAINFMTLVTDKESVIQVPDSSLNIISHETGRDELLSAVKQIVSDKSSGILNGEPLDQELFMTYLTHPEIPFPDLVLRTGNNHIVGDSLLWQMAYSEFWSTPKHWNELVHTDIEEALACYQSRERRFGQVIKSAS